MRCDLSRSCPNVCPVVTRLSFVVPPLIACSTNAPAFRRGVEVVSAEQVSLKAMRSLGETHTASAAVDAVGYRLQMIRIATDLVAA